MLADSTFLIIISLGIELFINVRMTGIVMGGGRGRADRSKLPTSSTDFLAELYKFYLFTSEFSSISGDLMDKINPNSVKVYNFH